MRDHISTINATLSEMQQPKGKQVDIDLSQSLHNGGLAVHFVYDRPYVAQLQLIRMLRPPRLRDMCSNSGNMETD